MEQLSHGEIVSSARARRVAVGVLLSVGALLLAVLAFWPTFTNGAGGRLSARYDWRYFETLAEIARRSVLWYGQAPLWNPYSCGGEVDLANPQSLTAAPTFVLTLLFGTAWGFKLAMLVYTWLGLFGMYVLARRLRLSLGAAVLAAVSFGLSGYLAMHLSVGHINFASVGLFPLLIYCYDRALSETEWLLPASGLAAWVAVYGGTFTPILLAELLGMWALSATLFPFAESHFATLPLARRLLRAVLILAALPLFALLIGAVRMLPALEFLRDHPRPLFRRTPDMSTLSQLPWDLFAWRKVGGLPGRRYWAHEYTARLPQVVLPMLLFGVAFARTRLLALRLMALAALGALLAMGNFSSYAPWSLAQKLPIARDLRVPSRNLLLCVFFVALAAGAGLDAAIRWLGQRRLRHAKGLALAAALIVCTVASADVVLYQQWLQKDSFTVPVAQPDDRLASAVPFFHLPGHWSQMREIVFAGRGVLVCDEEAPLQRAKELDVGDVPQLRFADPSVGNIESHRFTPNRRQITVSLQRGGVLLVNSNWNEHWRVDRGRVVSVDGRLAVDLSALPPGRYDLTLRYAPASFAVGLAMSCLGIPLCAVLFFWARRRRTPQPAKA